MKVLVCGGRDYGVDGVDGVDDVTVTPNHLVEQVYLMQILNVVHRRIGITQLIHGAARGADSLAGEWASGKGVEVRAFPAEWDRYGKRAAPSGTPRCCARGSLRSWWHSPGPAAPGIWCRSHARLG